MRPDDRLLVAAFGTRDSALAAWREWLPGRDLDALSDDELRLLPAVFHNLRDSSADMPQVAVLMARTTFIRSRLLLRDAAKTAARLDALLLKGAALMIGGMVEIGSRPMSDFDLLVRPPDAERAIDVLQDDGWVADPPLREQMVDFHHAARFKRGESSCDLHWWSLWEMRDAAADGRMFDTAEEVVFDGVPLRLPRGEQLVLHVIVHGTRAFDPSSVRWIGDALAVLRSRTIDWDVFAHEAESRGVAHAVAAALAYLRDAFGAAIPDETIRRLDAQRVGLLTRRLYSPASASSWRRTAYVHALLRIAAAQRGRRFAWLSRNVQHDFAARSLWHVATGVTSRALRKLRRAMTSKT